MTSFIFFCKMSSFQTYHGITQWLYLPIHLVFCTCLQKVRTCYKTVKELEAHITFYVFCSLHKNHEESRGGLDVPLKQCCQFYLAICQSKILGVLKFSNYSVVESSFTPGVILHTNIKESETGDERFNFVTKLSPTLDTASNPKTF